MIIRYTAAATAALALASILVGGVWAPAAADTEGVAAEDAPSAELLRAPSSVEPPAECADPATRRAYKQGRARARGWLRSMFAAHFSCREAERFVRSVRVNPLGDLHPEPVCAEAGARQGMNETVAEILSQCGVPCLQGGLEIGVQKAQVYCDNEASFPGASTMNPLMVLEPAVPLCTPAAAQACRAAFLATVASAPRCGFGAARSFAIPERWLSIRVEETPNPETYEDLLDKFCKPRP